MDWETILAPYTQLIDGQGDPVDAPCAVREMTPQPLSGGLINDTFALGEGHIVQRLHPIFRKEVNEDIGVLSGVLRGAGLPVPRLNPTESGALYTVVEGDRSAGGGVWRVMTWLPGRCTERVEDLDQAASIGAMFGRFYGALRGVEYTFQFSRPGAHDTQKHINALVSAQGEHPEHRLIRLVDRLCEEIQMRWGSLPKPAGLPRRIVHGDPKVANVLFDASNSVSAVLDLDTMGWSTLDSELGDAMRSWCNATTESAGEASFCLERFEAAMRGLASSARGWMTREEWDSVVLGMERICIELSARFAADALRESYFGWDAERFETRGDHNVQRARTQLLLARDVRRKRGDALEIAEEIWLG